MLDIGGGMPADYASDACDADVPGRITASRYVAALRQVPELFDFALVTEFGRHLAAKCGLLVSRVEWRTAARNRPRFERHFRRS